MAALESPDDVARVASLVPQDSSYANRTTYNSLIVAGRCINGSFAVSAKVQTAAISLVMACADEDAQFSGVLDLSPLVDGPVAIEIGFLKSTVSTTPIFTIVRVVTKDTEDPPAFTIPSSLTELNKAVAFTEVEGAALYNVTFTPAGGGAAIGPISSTTPSVPVSSLIIGTTYTVSVVALDAAGNETSASNTATFLKTDTDPPVFTSIALANEALGGYVGDLEKNATSDLVGPLTGSGYATVRYAVGLSSVACSAMTTYGSSIPSPADMVGGDGNYKVCVELQDDAANITYGTSAVIRRDTVLPVVTLTSSSPVSPANSLRPRIIGTVDSVSTVTLYSDSGCTVAISAGAANAALASPGILVTADVTANDTTSIYASAVDLAENTSVCTLTPFSYVHDNVAPEFTSVSLVNEAVGGYVNLSEKDLTTDLVGGLVAAGQSETKYAVAIGVDDTVCSGLSYSSSIPTPASLTATGTYVVCVRLRDAAGNTTYGASSTITKDISRPTLTTCSYNSFVSDGYVNAADQASATELIQNEAFSEPLLDTQYEIVSSSTSCNMVDPYTLSAAPKGTDVTGTDGSKKVCIHARDLAQNDGWLSCPVFTLETALPNLDSGLELAGHPATGYLNASDRSGTSAIVTAAVANETSTYNYVAVASSENCSAAVGYQSSRPLANTTQITSDGTYKICVKMTDTAGNVNFDQTGITFEVDTAPPTVDAGVDLILSGTSPDTNGGASASGYSSLTWSNRSPGVGSITFDDAALLNNTVLPDADGVYTLRLTATDAAGNTVYDELSLTWSGIGGGGGSSSAGTTTTTTGGTTTGSTTTGSSTAGSTATSGGGSAEVHLAYVNTGSVNVGYLHGIPGGTPIDDPAFAALDSGYNLLGAALTLDSSDLPWISFTGKNVSSLQSNVATSVTLTNGFPFNGTAFQATPVSFSGDSAIAIRAVASPFDAVAMTGWTAGNFTDTALSHRFNSIANVNSGFPVSSTELAHNTVTFSTPAPRGYSATSDSADKIHLVSTVKGSSGYDEIEYRTYDGSAWSAALTAGGRLNKSDNYAGTSCMSSNMPGIAFDRVNTGEGVHLVYYCSQSVDEIMHLWWDGNFWHYEGILVNVNMMVPAANQNSRLGFAIYNGIGHVAYWDSSGDLRHSKGTKTHASSAAGYTVSGTPGNYTITATVESGSHYFTEGQTVLISNDTNNVLNGSVQIHRIDDQNFSFVSATDPGAAGEFTVPIWKYIWSTPDLVDSIAGGGTFHTPQVAIDSTGYARIAYVHQSQVNGSETKSDIRLWYENSGGTSPDTATLQTYTHATNKIFLGYGLGITGSAISAGGTTGGTTTSTTSTTTTTGGTTGGTTAGTTDGTTDGTTTSTTGGTTTTTSGGTTTTTTSGTTGGVTCTVGQDPVGLFACCKFGSQCVDRGIQWSCPDVGYIVGLMAGTEKCFPDTAGFNACNATSVSTSTGGGSSGSTSTTTGSETAGSTTTVGTECVTNGLAAEFAASCTIDDQGALSCPPPGRQFSCSNSSDIVGSLGGDPTCFVSDAMATTCGATVIDEGTSTSGSTSGSTTATGSSSGGSTTTTTTGSTTATADGTSGGSTTTTATGSTTTTTDSTSGGTTTATTTDSTSGGSTTTTATGSTTTTTDSTSGGTTTATTTDSTSGGSTTTSSDGGSSTCRSWTLTYGDVTLNFALDLGQETFDALNTETTWTFDGASLNYTTPTGPVAIDVATQLSNAGGSPGALGSGSGMGGSLTVVSNYSACPPASAGTTTGGGSSSSSSSSSGSSGGSSGGSSSSIGCCRRYGCSSGIWMLWSTETSSMDCTSPATGLCDGSPESSSRFYYTWSSDPCI